MQAGPVSGGGRAGFLGPAYDPFTINDDPANPLAELRLPADVSAQRFDSRANLLAVLDGVPSPARAAEEHAAFRRSAARLLRSGKRAHLFHLDNEPPRPRDRYCRHPFGPSLLL